MMRIDRGDRDLAFVTNDAARSSASQRTSRPSRRPLRRVPAATVSGQVADVDPYTLVLLAEQESQHNRSEQASYLIEAAYARYDSARFGSMG